MMSTTTTTTTSRRFVDRRPSLFRGLCALLLLGAVAGLPVVAEDEGGAAAPADDTVPNVYYERWAGFAPGSWALARMETSLPGGGLQVQEMKTMLVAVSPEKVELESVSVTIRGTERVEGKPDRTTFQARVRRSPAVEDAERHVVERGEEKVTIGDAVIATTWKKTVTENDGMKTTVTEWTSDEVPGGLVRMTTLSEGMITVKSTLGVVEFEATK